MLLDNDHNQRLHQKSIHIKYQRSMTTTINALSSETSSGDGGRFTPTYTAF